VAAIDGAVLGGRFNTVSGVGQSCSIVGGESNSITGGTQGVLGLSAGSYSTIAGGYLNTINSGTASFIGGGAGNQINKSATAVIAGGSSNIINRNSSYSAIFGGASNTIQGDSTAAVIIGGDTNTITGNYSFALGQENIVGSTWIGGVMGYRCHTSGDYSFAAGYRARIPLLHTGAMVFTDALNYNKLSPSAHSLSLYFRNGVYITGSGGLYVQGEADFLGGISLSLKRTAPTSYPYTVQTNDFLVAVNSSSSRLINLPSAVGLSGRTYIIKDELGSASTGVIRVKPTGSQLIDNMTGYNLNINYGAIQLYSNNANWYII
jgi:hypothetical protein